MQNMNKIAVGEVTALRELPLEETEMVGGGFSWGGLVHNVEHTAAKVGSKLGDAVVNGVGTAIGGAVAAAKYLKKEAPKVPEPPFIGPLAPKSEPWFGV
jgi:hypothetical protein